MSSIINTPNSMPYVFGEIEAPPTVPSTEYLNVTIFCGYQCLVFLWIGPKCKPLYSQTLEIRTFRPFTIPAYKIVSACKVCFKSQILVTLKNFVMETLTTGLEFAIYLML